MHGTERVKLTLGAFVKPRWASFLAQRVHTVTAASEHFARIALVAHVPDQLVPWRVENGMERYGKPYNAKRRSKGHLW